MKFIWLLEENGRAGALLYTFTFSHLAGAFIRSDLQMRNIISDLSYRELTSFKNIDATISQVS